mgnify:FL=1
MYFHIYHVMQDHGNTSYYAPIVQVRLAMVYVFCFENTCLVPSKDQTYPAPTLTLIRLSIIW